MYEFLQIINSTWMFHMQEDWRIIYFLILEINQMKLDSYSYD